MKKELTIGELKGLLEDVNPIGYDAPVRLFSDTDVDQGEGDVIIEKAWFDNDSLVIYANDTGGDYDV